MPMASASAGNGSAASVGACAKTFSRTDKYGTRNGSWNKKPTC